jgi:hypothetical protein
MVRATCSEQFPGFGAMGQGFRFMQLAPIPCIMESAKQGDERNGVAGFAVRQISTRCGKERKRLGGIGVPDGSPHPLPGFLQECDSMGVEVCGSAEDLVLKGTVASDEW